MIMHHKTLYQEQERHERYLEECKEKKGSETLGSNIHVIEINLSTLASWV